MNDRSMGKSSVPRLLLAACGFGLLAVLQGCAHHLAARGPCNQGVCKAEVTVLSCEKGAMPVTPDPIRVSESNNIEWTIETDGYVFAENGIVIEGKGFKNRPGATGNGKKFIVHDDHTDKRPDIKYVVRVTRKSDGKACAPYDPFISNH
ncbi:MAG: hypothetical protein IPH30_00480 [Betaproteobacteria bacterium]|nr:hypothetical protein [Betaproteobacteria bacterium]